MRIRTAAAAFTLVSALSIAACSSDDQVVVDPTVADRSDGATTSPTSPTTSPRATTTASPERAAFVDDGNTICAAMNQELIALYESTDGQGTTAALVGQVLTRTGEVVGAAVEQLEVLPPPAGDEQQVEEMLADVRAVVALLPQAADAATRGDQAQYRALATQLDSVTALANASTAAYGLTECARSDLSNESA